MLKPATAILDALVILMVLFHIQSGSFGDVKLDGLEVIVAESWPKAIHEGNGTFQLFVTKTADGSQRQALVNIFSGKAKGDGPFVLFASFFVSPTTGNMTSMSTDTGSNPSSSENQ